MGDRPKVLAFAGSARPESFNRKIVRIAARGAEQAGATVALLDLEALRLPLYDQETEERHGFPEPVLRLKRIMCEQDGFLFAAPEYNASVSAPMKNAIDWASRPLPGEEWKACFAGKSAAIMSASPGPLGGLRGLVHLRAILASIHVLIIPQQLVIAKADQAFDEAGNLHDGEQQARAEKLGAQLVELLKKMAA